MSELASAAAFQAAKMPPRGTGTRGSDDATRLGRDDLDAVEMPGKKPQSVGVGMHKKGKKGKGKKGGKKGGKKKKVKEPEPEEEKPPTPPPPWRPADTAPDYGLLSVTPSIVDLKENVDIVLDHLVEDEGVKNYTSEYVRMFESTATAHVEKRDCCKKAERLREKNEEFETAVEELKTTVTDQAQELEKREKAHDMLVMETNMRRAREVNMIEVIGSLRKELSRYNPQNLPNESGDEEATNLVNRLNAKNDALMDELVNYKERLADTYKTLEAVEIEQAQAKEAIVILEDKLQSTENDYKTAATRQVTVEEELRDEKTLNIENREHIAHLSMLLEEAGQSINKMKSTLDQQKKVFNSLQREHESANRHLNELVRNNTGLQEKLGAIKSHSEEGSRRLEILNEQLAKCSKNNSRLEERLRAVQKHFENEHLVHVRLLEEKKMLLTDQKARDKALVDTRKHLAVQEIENQSLKVKTQDLEGKYRRSEFTINELNSSIRMLNKTKRRIDQDYRNAREDNFKLERQVKDLWRQKKKCQDDQAVLALELELKDEEVQNKLSEVLRCKKSLDEMQVQLQLNLNAYDNLMSQRNTLSKNVHELEGKLALTNSDLKLSTVCIEQLKENLSAQENKIQILLSALNMAAMAKKELAGKVNKLKERERQLMTEIKAMKRKQTDYIKQIKDLEAERDKTKLHLKEVAIERDVIGSQLIRRNDEIQRLRSINDTIQRQALLADSHYQQRENDIRLLRTEVKHYRHRVDMLKNAAPTVDTRRELYHLNVSLIKESNKRKALEIAATNPLNIHRWRKLYIEDPTRFELIRKVDQLQRRILKQSENKMKQDLQLREAERLFVTLNQAVCKLPGHQTGLQLVAAKRKLGDQIRCSKALVAELRVTAADSCHTKLQLSKARNELNDFKNLYKCAKKTLDSNGIALDDVCLQSVVSDQREDYTATSSVLSVEEAGTA